MPRSTRDRPVQVLGLDHVVLRVTDIDASIKWYEQVFGSTVERRLSNFGLYQLRVGESLIDLVPVRSRAGRAGGGGPGKKKRNMDHFAVRLAHFDAGKIRTYLRRRGIEPGEVQRRYGAQGHGPSMYLSDPDGNTVELKGPPDKDQTETAPDAEYPSGRGKSRTRR
ncbi:MAG: VOC family protein [Gammaproteobacteria bacterium]|nr:VOC family protein [Gammaproteobacteria bacterium]